MSTPTLPADRVLILRTSDKDHRSHGGFQWPTEVGSVIVPERWSPKPQCGDGIHGLPFGQGDHGSFTHPDDGVWQVIEAAADSMVALDGKVKVPSGILMYVGTLDGAKAYLREHAGDRCPPIGGLPGDAASATGDRGASSATGDRGASSATGDRGASSATGYGSVVWTEGTSSVATVSGDKSSACAMGKESVAVSCGFFGAVRAGESGAIVIAERDKDDGHLIAWHFGVVGKDGIQANRWYEALNGKLSEITSPDHRVQAFELKRAELAAAAAPTTLEEVAK